MNLKDFSEKHGLNYEMVKSWKKRGKLQEKLREKGLAIIEGETEESDLLLASKLKNHIPVDDPSLPKIQMEEEIQDEKKTFYTPFQQKWIEDHKHLHEEGWPWGVELMPDEYLKEYEKTGKWGKEITKGERAQMLKAKGMGWMVNEEGELGATFSDCSEEFIPAWKINGLKDKTEAFKAIMEALITSPALKGAEIDFMGFRIFAGSRPSKKKESED